MEPIFLPGWEDGGEERHSVLSKLSMEAWTQLWARGRLRKAPWELSQGESGGQAQGPQEGGA